MNIKYPTLKSNIKIFISLTILLSILTVKTSAEQTLDFANHLFDTGDYYRAITEYQRYQFTSPKSKESDFVNLKIALAYLEGKEYDTAFQALDKIINIQDHEYTQIARLRLAGGLYTTKQYNNAITIISPTTRTSNNKQEIEVFLGLCMLQNKNPEKAKIHFNTIQSEIWNSKNLLESCIEYENLNQKKTWLAGTLSALLPGSGQLYVKRPHDAAWAFLLNTVFLSATYYAFENDETVAGIFAASLEAVWYTGNIYNAANGAKKYNQHQHDIFIKQLEEKTIYNQDKPIYQLLFRIPL